MMTSVGFEQYKFDIQYDVVEGDFYAADYVNWEAIAGQWCDQDDNLFDMSQEEVYCESELFQSYIDELLKKELTK